MKQSNKWSRQKRMDASGGRLALGKVSATAGGFNFIILASVPRLSQMTLLKLFNLWLLRYKAQNQTLPTALHGASCFLLNVRKGKQGTRTRARARQAEEGLLLASYFCHNPQGSLQSPIRTVFSHPSHPVLAVNWQLFGGPKVLIAS